MEALKYRGHTTGLQLRREVGGASKAKPVWLAEGRGVSSGPTPEEEWQAAPLPHSLSITFERAVCFTDLIVCFSLSFNNNRVKTLVDDVYELGTNNHILGTAEQFVVHGYLNSVCKSAQAVDFGYDLQLAQITLFVQVITQALPVTERPGAWLWSPKCPGFWNSCLSGDWSRMCSMRQGLSFQVGRGLL